MKPRKRPPATALRLNRDYIDLAKHCAIDERISLTKLVDKAIIRYLRSRPR